MARRTTENVPERAVVALCPSENCQYSDPEATVAHIAYQLANERDRSVRASALETALSYAKNETLRQQCGNFSPLALGLADCLADPDASHVRCACELISACCYGLKDHYVTSIKPIIPALFRQLDNEIRIVAHPCRSALIDIARHVRHRRTIATFLEHSPPQGKEQRNTLAESLALMLQEWPKSITKLMSAEIQSALKAVGPPEVRRQQKATPTSTGVRFVEFLEPPEVADVEHPKSIMKRPKSRQVESLVNPTTMETAERFLQFLTDHIKSNGFIEKLNAQKETLPEAVLAAVQFIPEYMDWEDVVLPLFRSFANFIDVVPELLALFRFDRGFFRSICEIFSADALCQRFVKVRCSQQTVALKFFLLVIGSDVAFTLTDDLRRYLNRLVHNAADRRASEPIRSYLSTSANPRSVLVDFLDKFSRQSDFTAELARLVRSEFLTDYEPELESAFLRALMKGTDVQRANLASVISALSTLTFPTFREGLLKCVMRKDFAHRDTALACAAAMLQSRSVLVELIASVTEDDALDEAKEEAALEILHRVVSEATPERLRELLPAMFGYVLDCIEGDVAVLARTAVFISVEFNMKIGSDFGQFLQKLSPKNQRLIALYTAKSQK
jgi:hypothetical protein